MCLATSNNLLLMQQDAPKRIFFPRNRDLLVSGQNKRRGKDFSPPSVPFPRRGNSGGICIASQFFPQPSLPFSRPLNKISYLVAQDDIRLWIAAVREPLHTGIRAHTNILSSWIHLILSSNHLRKVKTLLQDSF